MAKIKYNKEKPGRILMGRGPRDIQLRQKALREQEIYKRLSPNISAETADSEVVKTEIDTSQYLPIDEVRKKIEEATNSVREEERKRYESGLKNLNDQLNNMRKRATAAEEQLISANTEINRLNNIITSQKGLFDREAGSLKAKISSLEQQLGDRTEELANKSEQLARSEQIINGLRQELENIKNELHNKELEITRLQTLVDSNQSTEIVDLLQAKLDQLYEKISDGSIGPLVGSKISKPELEDRIFIDPLEDSVKEKEANLDTHIDVKEEQKEIKRSVEEDISKLRKLLRL